VEIFLLEHLIQIALAHVDEVLDLFVALIELPRSALVGLQGLVILKDVVLLPIALFLHLL